MSEILNEHGLPYTLRDHSLIGDELVGHVVGEDGEPVTAVDPETMEGPIPISGPINLGSVGDALGKRPISMASNESKDLIQQTGTVKMSQFYGGAWGSPFPTIEQGAGGMTISKWDWRYDGDPAISGAGDSTTGTYGAAEHFAQAKNNASMTAPGAYTGNGYFVATSNGLHRLTFDWSRYSKSNSQHNGYMAIAVLGYNIGYLNGTRNEQLKFTNFNPMNIPSGSGSYEFYTNSYYKHTVVNFNWWCPGYSSAIEGIECAITNCKVTRIS